MRWLRAAALVSAWCVVTAQAPAAEPERVTVRVTWYGYESCTNPECLTASGIPAYIGGAACSYRWPLGSQLRFVLDGRVVTCVDRGYLGPAHVDIWAGSPANGHYLARLYGDWADVETIRWGWGEDD